MKLNNLAKISEGFPLTEKMPVLFLGHGSPMNAIEENEFVKGFRGIAKTIATPNAILCVSAHWFTKGTKVTAMEMPKTIHDFGGFPQALFDVQYPAKGSPSLAQETKTLLSPALVELDEKWGLDVRIEYNDYAHQKAGQPAPKKYRNLPPLVGTVSRLSR